MLNDDWLSEGLSLPERTMGTDKKEGSEIQDLIANSSEPIPGNMVEVPDDLKNNLVVTSIDADGLEAGALAEIMSEEE